MTVDLTGVYFVGTLLALGGCFLLATVVTLALDAVEAARAEEGRPRRERGYYGAASGIVGVACFLFADVNPLPRAAFEWVDEHAFVLVPGTVLLWWGLLRVLRRSAERQRRTSGNSNVP